MSTLTSDNDTICNEHLTDKFTTAKKLKQRRVKTMTRVFQGTKKLRPIDAICHRTSRALRRVSVLQEQKVPRYFRAPIFSILNSAKNSSDTLFPAKIETGA